MLALDDVPSRTYANTYNLALMAKLAYTDDPGSFFSQNFDRACARDELIPFRDDDNHVTHTPIVRAAPDELQGQSGAQYQVRMLRSASDPLTDTHLFVVAHPTYLLISVRGTEMSLAALGNTITDLVTDVRGSPENWMRPSGAAPGPQMLVPTGFFLAIGGIVGQLRTWLDSVSTGADDRRPFFITGHSLGGAIATLIACHLRDLLPSRKINLYTFAQPRCTSAAMARYYWVPRNSSLRYYRFAHRADGVPMVPRANLYSVGSPITVLLQTLFSRDFARAHGPAEVDYRHFGRLMRLGSDTGRIENWPGTENTIEADGMLTAEDYILSPTVRSQESVSMDNHKMQTYFHAIELELELNAAAWRSAKPGSVTNTLASDEIARVCRSIQAQSRPG